MAGFCRQYSGPPCGAAPSASRLVGSSSVGRLDGGEELVAEVEQALAAAVGCGPHLPAGQGSDAGEGGGGAGQRVEGPTVLETDAPIGGEGRREGLALARPLVLDALADGEVAGVDEIGDDDPAAAVGVGRWRVAFGGGSDGGVRFAEVGVVVGRLDEVGPVAVAVLVDADGDGVGSTRRSPKFQCSQAPQPPQLGNSGCGVARLLRSTAR